MDNTSDDGSDEDDDGEATPMPSTSKKAAKTLRGPNKKRAKTVELEDEDEEMEFSESEVSQKRFLKGSGKSADKKKKGSGKKPIAKKFITKSKKSFKTITKNYCPDDAPDKQHKYYFRAFIGGGFHVSLAKWLRNNQKYIQIRKATTGANIPVSQFKYLKKAIIDMENDCPKELMKNELSSSESD